MATGVGALVALMGNRQVSAPRRGGVLPAVPAGPPHSSGLDVFSTVVAGGFCVGCGACAGLDSALSIRLDEEGQYVAVPSSRIHDGVGVAERVCPFSASSANEDVLGLELFGAGTTADPSLGRYLATWAGWVVEGTFRQDGSSGGLTTWLLVEALRSGLADAAVHVVMRPGSRPLFEYGISTSEEEVRRGAKSRYYPVEMSGLIRMMTETPGRYAVVALPCFAKALRLACRESEVLRERVALVVGLFCGHMKSTGFAESMAWQSGIRPDEIEGIDFRHKRPEGPASRYGVRISGRSGQNPVVVENAAGEYFASQWGEGMFKSRACEFCDDVVGETSDVSIGDAWLPRYDGDPKGTNLVVVRSRAVARMLERASVEGRVHLEQISVDEVVASQAGGFRHRREGLAHRLQLEDSKGRWRPPKRVLPSSAGISRRRRRIYEMRTLLAAASHDAFRRAREADDLDVFLDAMRPRVKRYRRMLRPSIQRRAADVLRRVASRVRRMFR